jgi:hypothetical protein
MYFTSVNTPDQGDNYGAMVRGYFKPTESASYDFFIRSDDASGLWINRTGDLPPDPEASAPDAYEAGCCGAFMEPGDPRTTAAPIALTAGTKYGFTALVKEGGGGDYVQVAWRKVGDTTAAADLQPIGAAFIGTYAPVSSTLPTISAIRQGNNLTITFTGRLFRSATAEGPYTEVTGTTGGTYTVNIPDAPVQFYRSAQ